MDFQIYVSKSVSFTFRKTNLHYDPFCCNRKSRVNPLTLFIVKASFLYREDHECIQIYLLSGLSDFLLQQMLQKLCIHLPGVQYRVQGLNPSKVNIPCTPFFTMHEGTFTVLAVVFLVFHVEFSANEMDCCTFTVKVKSNVRRTSTFFILWPPIVSLRF